MPLDGKAALPIQFSGGVETRQDPKQVPATKLLDLQNAVFTKQTTLSKRNGYRALSQAIQSAGGNITDARGMGMRDDERLLFTDKRCYSYRPSVDKWADSGEVAATTASTLPIGRTGTYQTQPDVAERNGIRVFAWEDSRGGIRCSVIEIATGRILQSQTIVDSSTSAKNTRCIAVGEIIHILWTRQDVGQIFYAIVNPATPTTAPVPVIMTTDLDGGQPFFDAESAVNAPILAVMQRPGLIAWARSGGGFRVGYLLSSGALVSVATYADVLSGPIAVAWDQWTGTSIAVMWVSTGMTVLGRLVDPLTLSTTLRSVSTGVSATSYTRITCAFASTPTGSTSRCYWAAEIGATRSDLSIIESGAISVSPSSDVAPTRLRGHGLASRAWCDSSATQASTTAAAGDVYVIAAHTVRFFPYVAALRLSGPGIAAPGSVVVSRLIPGEAAGSLMRPTGAGVRAWTQHLPSVISAELAGDDIATRKHSVCIPYRIQLSSQNGDQFSEQGVKLATIDFSVGYQTSQLGRGLYLASSMPMHYDGEAWRELDFHAAPDFGFDSTGAPVDMTTTITLGGVGLIPTGSYLYAYWYEAVDAQGELHRGAVSTKMLFAVTGGPKVVSHALPTCRLTRFSNVRICVARSAIGATGTDATIPLYKVTSNDVTVSTGNNRYVLNDPTVDTVAFVDNLTDAALITREPLYTNGGILSNNPSPWGGKLIAGGKNRLFWDDSTNPHLVRYSQEIQDDTAIEAPVDLSIPVDPFGGAVVAVAIMDSVVYPLCETAIYGFSGPGPDRDGSLTTQDGFSQADLVTSDVGCSSAGSVGQTPEGVIFQSTKGIQLLARSRQVGYVGAPVEVYNEQTFVRCTLLPDRQQIILLTSTTGGRSLLWDYARNQWSTFTNHVGLDAIVVDGEYHYLRPDSRVFQETPGVHVDDNSHIPMVIETAWVHFAQYLQGWQRILYAYFLGAYQSPHTLSVSYRLDYNDGYRQPILSDVNGNYNPSVYGAGAYGAGFYGGAGGGGTRYQRRIHINKRCQAISFKIQDIEATSDFGASFELSELLLIGGGIGADFKVGASRSA